ncbi:MAG: hypothetical protein AAFV96_17840, partial [Pseudomonadota bacterium]
MRPSRRLLILGASALALTVALLAGDALPEDAAVAALARSSMAAKKSTAQAATAASSGNASPARR